MRDGVASLGPVAPGIAGVGAAGASAIEELATSIEQEGSVLAARKELGSYSQGSRGRTRAA